MIDKLLWLSYSKNEENWMTRQIHAIQGFSSKTRLERFENRPV